MILEGEMRRHWRMIDQAIDGWVNTDMTSHILISRAPEQTVFRIGFLLMGRGEIQDTEKHLTSKSFLMAYV